MRKNTGNTKMKILKPLKELFSSYYKHFSKTHFSMNGSFYYPTKFCQKKFLMASLIRNNQKCWVWVYFFNAIPRYNLSKSLIFLVRKIFREIWSSGTIWKYRDKTSLRNIKTGRGITISYKDTQIEFLIIFNQVFV